MTENSSHQEANFQDLLIIATEFQIATINFYIEFWLGWLEQATKFSKATSLGLEKMKLNSSDAGKVMLEISEASRENLRALTNLPKCAIARLTQNFSKKLRDIR